MSVSQRQPEPSVNIANTQQTSPSYLVQLITIYNRTSGVCKTSKADKQFRRNISDKVFIWNFHKNQLILMFKSLKMATTTWITFWILRKANAAKEVILVVIIWNYMKIEREILNIFIIRLIMFYNDVKRLIDGHHDLNMLQNFFQNWCNQEINTSI